MQAFSVVACLGLSRRDLVDRRSSFGKTSNGLATLLVDKLELERPVFLLRGYTHRQSPCCTGRLLTVFVTPQHDFPFVI